MPKKKIPTWREELAEINEEALCADGFEDAYLGWAESRWVREGGPAVAVYSRRKCIQILMKRDGMSEEEAVEFFEFNVEGAYVGPNTPIFLVEWR